MFAKSLLPLQKTSVVLSANKTLLPFVLRHTSALFMEALQKRLESDSSDVGTLLRAIFLPKIYGDNLRFASEGAGVRSATGNLSQILDVGTDWATATQTQAIPASDMMAFAFANPLRSFVYYIHNFANDAYNYIAIPNNNLANWPLPIGNTVQSYFLGASADPLLPNFQPHGDYLAAGHDAAGNTYLWVDNSPLGSGNMTVTLDINPGGSVGAVSWWYWNGKSATLLETQLFTGASAIYNATTIPAGGAYLFVRVSNTIGSPVTSFTLSVNGSHGVWAHRSIPQLVEYLTVAVDDVYRVSGIRVNACAFKAQNDSQEIEKNGNLISVTVASKIPWSNIAAGTSYLSNLQNYRERSNNNGYYGVLLPDSDDDISEFFDDVIPSTQGTNTVASFPLIERRPYKALGITAPIATGRNFLFDVTHCIEYLTNWQIQSLDNPRTSEESLTAAIVLASTMETDYENPTHWRDVIASIGKFGENLVGFQLEGPFSGVLDTISKFHPAMTLARVLGKNVVLPAQKGLFQEMQRVNKKSRGPAYARGGYNDA